MPTLWLLSLRPGWWEHWITDFNGGFERSVCPLYDIQLRLPHFNSRKRVAKRESCVLPLISPGGWRSDDLRASPGGSCSPPVRLVVLTPCQTSQTAFTRPFFTLGIAYQATADTWPFPASTGADKLSSASFLCLPGDRGAWIFDSSVPRRYKQENEWNEQTPFYNRLADISRIICTSIK